MTHHVTFPRISLMCARVRKADNPGNASGSVMRHGRSGLAQRIRREVSTRLVSEGVSAANASETRKDKVRTAHDR